MYFLRFFKVQFLNLIACSLQEGRDLGSDAMTQSKLLLVLFTVSAMILVLGAIQNSAIAYPQQKQGYSHHNKMMMQPGLYAFGTIASLQFII